MSEVVHIEIIFIVAEWVWGKGNVRNVKNERMMWDSLSISSPATKKPKKTKAWSRTIVGQRCDANGCNATHHHSGTRNCDPAQGLPDLEGEG